MFHADDFKPAVDVSSLSSLLEQEVKYLAQTSGNNLLFKNIVTITTYSYQDKFEGFLVYFKVENVDSSETFHFEVKIINDGEDRKIRN